MATTGPRRKSPVEADLDGQEKRFEQTVTVELEDGPESVRDTRQAAECLLMRWPANRGPRHRDAVDACLKVLDGHRSVIDAQNAFVAAAEESGILAGDKQPLASEGAIDNGSGPRSARRPPA